MRTSTPPVFLGVSLPGDFGRFRKKPWLIPNTRANRASLGTMRKALVLFLALSVSALGFSPTYAATKASTVTAAFKTLLNSSSTALDDLEQKYETDIDGLDTTLLSAVKAADDTYNQDLLAATNRFAPQIAAATKKSEEAKTTYESNNKVRLTTGFFGGGENDRINWVLDCLPPRANGAFKMLKRICAAVEGIPTFGDGFGGEDWQSGDITTIALRNADDKYTAIGIEKGYIVPINLTAFDSSRIGYKQALADIASLTTKNGEARAAARDKRDKLVTIATSARESALANLNEIYEATKAQLEAQANTANLALLAAKRAAKDASNFDSAFVIAYKFEYNRKMVGEIADAAWTGDWTYRTIDSIIKVNRLAALGDGIATKYSKSAAASFNSAVGNAFTNEPDFRAALKVLTSVYKQSTKSSLKI